MTTKPQNKLFLGFSLIELLIVISVFAILSALSIPSYRQYTANTKASSLATELMIAFRIARATAITEQKEIVVCALNTGGSSPSCNNTASLWNKGWLVALNDANESVVYKRFQFRSDASSINSGIEIDIPTSIVYSEDGFPTPDEFEITIEPPGCTSGFKITSTSGGILKRELISCS